MRKLVYYSLFGKEYCDLFLISFESLLKYSDDDTDVLVICNENDMASLRHIKCSKLKFLIVNCNSANDGAINRYRIFKYGDFNLYAKFLYLDADTLVIKNINLIFDNIKESNIYTNQGYMSTLNHPNYTIGLTTSEIKKIKDENRFGINSGIFAFTVDKMSFFRDLISFIEQSSFKNVPLYDQPYFGTFLLRNNPNYLPICCPLGTPNSKNILINNEAMSNIKSLDGLVILHFAGCIGDGKTKIEHIKNMQKRLNGG